ncbi:hypothetical protein ACFV1H_17795 [Streptomyces virginiae]|uniref:hypothetical protein n=1 Tax=Streptomyces virginiae TaxID=1961 RepID=UPI0036CA214B
MSAQQAEEGLRRARQDMPVAAQLLHAVADTLSDYQPGQPATPETLRTAFTNAGADVLGQYPPVVREHALDRALSVLPNEADLPPDVTSGELALHLRKAAGSLT